MTSAVRMAPRSAALVFLWATIAHASASSSSSSSGSDGDYIVKDVYRPFFWVFAAIGLVLFYYAFGYATKYHTTAAFLLPVSWFASLSLLVRRDQLTHLQYNPQPFVCASIVFTNVVSRSRA